MKLKNKSVKIVKRKTKKILLTIVSLLMIIIIFGDLAYPIRLFILGIRENQKYARPEGFDEDYQFTEPYTNLVLKISARDNLLDYGLSIAENLKSIGIEVEVKVEENSSFYSQLNYTHDYDMYLMSLNISEVDDQIFWKVGNFADPSNLNYTYSDYYEENISIPYVNQASELLKNASLENDIVKKRDYLFEWQKIVMDKILFIFPLFNIIGKQFNKTVLLGFNLARPFLGDSANFEYLTSPGKEEYTRGMAVRKTICYTIDRAKINQELNNGEYEVINSIVTPYQSFWINEEVPKYERDATLAFDWLEAAGYIIYMYMGSSYIFLYLLITSPIYLIVLAVTSTILYFSVRSWKKVSKEITKTKEIIKDGTY